MPRKTRQLMAMPSRGSQVEECQAVVGTEMSQLKVRKPTRPPERPDVFFVGHGEGGVVGRPEGSAAWGRGRRGGSRKRSSGVQLELVGFKGESTFVLICEDRDEQCVAGAAAILFARECRFGPELVGRMTALK